MKTVTYTGDPDNWHVDVYLPKLVERCRSLEADFFEHGDTLAANDWIALGVAEALNPPETRLGRVVTINQNLAPASVEPVQDRCPRCGNKGTHSEGGEEYCSTCGGAR